MTVVTGKWVSAVMWILLKKLWWKY